MTLFMVAKKSNVAQMEGLVIAAARPAGNKQKPKIGQDLRRSLRQYLKKDAAVQIDAAVYPDREEPVDPLARRISAKKLRSVSQARLAAVLGISQPRVSNLFKQNTIRQYIRQAGKRDAVLLLFQKASK